MRFVKAYYCQVDEVQALVELTPDHPTSDTSEGGPQPYTLLHVSCRRQDSLLQTSLRAAARSVALSGAILTHFIVT